MRNVLEHQREMKADEYSIEHRNDGRMIVRDNTNEIYMTSSESEADMYIRMRKAMQEAIYWKDMFLRLTEQINKK